MRLTGCGACVRAGGGYGRFGMASEADIARAVALHEEGRLEEAAAAYRAILKAEPDHAGVNHNLGVVLAQSGEPARAITMFDRALGARPDHVMAHVNRAGALESLGRDEDAEAAYGRALALQPDLYPAQLRRALLLLGLGRRAEAMDHFRATRALRRDPVFMGHDHASFAQTSRYKLAHDAAQFRYLAARGVEPDRFTALAALYEAALGGIAWPDDRAAVVDLDAAWRARLADSYNRALRAADATAGDSALNPALDGAAITRAYGEAAPGVAVIDDLLSPAALSGLRRFLLEATIWHDFAHIGGFLAAYLEDGMACPLLLRIVDALCRLLPDVLGPHPLRQAWAFKCLAGDNGIDVHADAGAVSVNFWVTPDEANLEPGAGGLVVHRVAPPPDWSLSDYDQDAPSIRRFLTTADAPASLVPYRDNRAVVFRSDLFHESDTVRFRPGYANHRINVTLLFGERGETGL